MRTAGRTAFALTVTALLVGALTAAPASRAEWVEWVVEPHLAETDTDNFNFTAFAGNEQDERLREAGLTVGRHFQIDELTRVRLTGAALARRHQNFAVLDGEDYSVLLALRHKFGVGRKAIWAQLYGEYTDINLDDRLRAGSRQQFGLRLGKRFSDRFDGVAELAVSERDGGQGLPRPTDPDRSTEVFDQQDQHLALQLNVLLWGPLLATVGYTWRDGEIDSQCPTANVSAVVATENPGAVSRDPDVFGGCVYRLDGPGRVYEWQFSYALSGHAAVQLGGRDLRGEGRELEYEAQQYRLAIVYSF